jgi:ribonuclease D
MLQFTYVSSNSEFITFYEYLLTNKINNVAIDFEAEFNLHVYGERLCLIQIFDKSNYWAIDPFKIDSTKIAMFLENDSIRKYGYGSDSDKSLLYKQYKIKIKSLFDLKNVVDFLAYDKKSLDAVLASVLNIASSKKKHFQTFNWTRRPLPKDAIEYALGDVQHLFALHEKLLEELKKKEKPESFADELMHKDYNYNKVSIPSIKRDYRYKDLAPKAKILFEQLLNFREEIAKKLDLPPDQIINKEYMYKAVSPNYDCTKINFSKRLSNSTINQIIEFIGKLIA